MIIYINLFYTIVNFTNTPLSSLGLGKEGATGKGIDVLGNFVSSLD